MHSIATNRMECNMTANNLDNLIRDTEAARIIGCSKSSFWRRVADGTFPQPMKIGGLSRWLKTDILDAFESAKKKRNESTQKAATRGNPEVAK
jgi:predicted DNA-binding transcriptional regulator AlpA